MADTTTTTTQMDTTTQAELAENKTEQEKKWTQADLDGKAAKEAAKKEQSILKQLGIENKDDLPNIAAELQALREAKAKEDADKPELERLKLEVERLKDIEPKLTQIQAEAQALKQEKMLKSKGVCDEQLEFMAFKINKLVTEDVTFEQALEEYIANNPINKDPVPVYYGGGASTIKEKKVTDMNKLLFGGLSKK